MIGTFNWRCTNRYLYLSGHVLSDPQCSCNSLLQVQEQFCPQFRALAIGLSWRFVNLKLSKFPPKMKEVESGKTAVQPCGHPFPPLPCTVILHWSMEPFQRPQWDLLCGVTTNKHSVGTVCFRDKSLNQQICLVHKWDIFLRLQVLWYPLKDIYSKIQGWQKRWTLGCVNSPSRPEVATMWDHEAPFDSSFWPSLYAVF